MNAPKSINLILTMVNTAMAKSPKKLRVVAVSVAMLFLSGCNVELYSQLAERDANEMIATLMRNGVESDKQIERDGSYTILVDKKLVAKALNILKDNGLPRARFENMGKLFEKDGLISSPMEERARFVYALQQNLQETLSQIDGVMVARVHVVVPENNPFAENAKPSSASVFIKHRPDQPLDDIRSEIKMIVGNSIQGLSYRDVSVTLVAAAKNNRNVSSDVSPFAKTPTHIAGMSNTFWIMLALGVLLVTLSTVFRTGRQTPVGSSSSATDSDAKPAN